MQTKKRPVFLTLHRITLPLTGFISITHRVTGVMLFLFLPVGLYLLQHSLESPEGFNEVSRWLDGGLWRLGEVMIVWWFAHHLLAGLRFLFIDADIGVELPGARTSARVILLMGVAVLLLSALEMI